MKEKEMELIADVMATVLADTENEPIKTAQHKRIKELCAAFPIYPDVSYV